MDNSGRRRATYCCDTDTMWDTSEEACAKTDSYKKISSGCSSRRRKTCCKQVNNRHYCDACSDTSISITSVEATGVPALSYVTAWDLNTCCTSANATTCGYPVGTSVKWTQSQSLTWSDTTTESVGIKAEEGLEVEGLTDKIESSITLTGTYTNGGSRSSSLSITTQTACGGTYQDIHYVNFIGTAVMYTVDVQITYTQCGEQKTMTGTVTSSAISGDFSCSVPLCKSSCDIFTGCDEVVALLPTVNSSKQGGDSSNRRMLVV